MALMGVLALGPCDPPASPITRDSQQFDTTCVDMRRNDLGPRLQDVLGPTWLAAARRIVGVDPSEAFAVRHDDSRHQCEDEDDGDWFLVHRVDLSRVRVEGLKQHVRASVS